MPVKLSRPPHILVVHGVQRGSSASVKLDQAVQSLCNRVLKASHISEHYKVRQFVYEDKNDKHPSVILAKALSGAVSKGRPLSGLALKAAVDLVGDVVLNASNSSVAGRVHAGLREAILESHEKGHRVLLLAHSLGSVYALQALNALIAEGQHFKGDDRRLWPVQGLVTLGSPLGLNMKVAGLTLFPKVDLAEIPSDVERLPWHNFYSVHDPVVSGRVFGTRVKMDGTDGPVERRYRSDSDARGWLLHGHTVNSGVKWLLAHTAYWKDPTVGVRLVSMLWG